MFKKFGILYSTNENGQDSNANNQDTTKPDIEETSKDNSKTNSKELNFRALEKAKAEAEAERDQLRAEKADKEKQELEQKGEYKQVIDKQKTEIEKLKEEIKQMKLFSVITNSIFKSGINADFQEVLEVALKKAIAENDKLDIDTFIEEYKTKKPHFFATTKMVNGNVGTPGTTNGDNTSVDMKKAVELAKNGDMRELKKLNLQL